jgi:hypothetical protein
VTVLAASLLLCHILFWRRHSIFFLLPCSALIALPQVRITSRNCRPKEEHSAQK